MSATPRMRCNQAAPYLSAYLDGELDTPLRDSVAAHLSGCDACRERLDRLARVDSLLASMPTSAPAPDLLDRVLAGAQRRQSPPAVRESLRRRELRPASRGLSPELLTDDVPSPQPLVRRRSLWVATLPALAALLIISMTVVAFHRLPSGKSVSTMGRPIASVVPLGTTIQQTRSAVEKYANQVAFTPALPTYLPPGSQAPIVTVGPANVGISSRVLDVVWRWSCATCEVSEVHLRETPLPLASRNDWGQPPPEPSLSWQVPGATPWRPGTLQDAADLSHWAVGQDRAGFSITLDVAGRGGATGAPTDVERNVLRLISLSMDLPYTALTVTPPNFASTEVQFTAQSSHNGVTWNVLMAPGNLEKVTVTGPAAQYTDVDNGTSVLRLALNTRTYATLPAAAAADPSMSAETQQFFLDANTFLSYGELWPLPGAITFDGAAAQRLFLVGAPYPTYVYVETTSQRVLGASVDYGSPLRPGGPGASSLLTPATGCLRYLQLAFHPWSASQSGGFQLTPPPNYTAGSVPRSMSC